MTGAPAPPPDLDASAAGGSGEAAGPAVVLAVGGSDSAGRCGVQADLRAFAALGVHGCCALTVVTAQDTERVRSAWPVPVEAVVQQVEVVAADLDVRATKVGMLGRTELVEALVALAGAGRLPRLVVDPVLVDGAGHPLFPPAFVDRLRTGLLPLAEVVTPNRDELALLTGRSVANLDELAAAAGGLADQLSGPVVVATGGRLGGAESADVVAGPGSPPTIFAEPRVATANVAGTGDSLSAAIAAGLARGVPVDEAVRSAKTFVARAVAGAANWHLGTGRGPIDHLAWNR